MQSFSTFSVLTNEVQLKAVYVAQCSTVKLQLLRQKFFSILRFFTLRLVVR